MQPLPIFLHIPKTAGTTFRSTLFAQYRKDELCLIYPQRFLTMAAARNLPAERLERVRFVSGHIEFGVHEIFSRRCEYVTIVRHPVQRVVSLYNHMKVNGRLPASLPLQDILRNAADPRWRQFCNHQTQVLTGARSCDEGTYQQALANLDQHFSLVGLTEKFDETVILAARRFGWPAPRYVPLNIKRPTASWSADDELLRLVSETNQWDLKLYAVLKERFDSLLARQDSGFQADVEALRARVKQVQAQRESARGAEATSSRTAAAFGIRGALGHLESDCVRGWAVREPVSEPVQVSLMINGEAVAVQTANHLRKQLAKRVHPTGECGFVFRLPPGKNLRAGDEVRVRVVGSDADLSQSPRVYEG